MNSKEKAKELVEKFQPFADVGFSGTDSIRFSNAKYIALIAVDEIIKVCPMDKFDTEFDDNIDFVKDHPEMYEEFWQQVKTEIQKL